MHPYEHLGYLPPFFPVLGLIALPVIMLLIAWTIVIKGFALWYAARNDQKVWFVVLLIVNTLGILEIVYLIWFRGDRTKQDETVVTPIEPTSTSNSGEEE